MKDRWNSWLAGRFPDLTEYQESLADTRDEAVNLALELDMVRKTLAADHARFLLVLKHRDEEIDRLNECIRELEKLVMT